jgi:cupin superfamily acireductone dioxygenase involved in methionine salvage
VQQSGSEGAGIYQACLSAHSIFGIAEAKERWFKVSAFRQMDSYLTLPNGIKHSSGLSFFSLFDLPPGR